MRHIVSSRYTIAFLIGVSFCSLEINTMWSFQGQLECLRKNYQQTIKKEVLEDVHRERENEIKLLSEVEAKLESTTEQLSEMKKGNYRMMPELKDFKRSSRPYDPDEVRRKENYKQKKLLHKQWAHNKDRDAQINFLLSRKERYEKVLKEHTQRLNALNTHYNNPDQYIRKLFTIVFPEDPCCSYRVHFGKERELDKYYDDKERARQRKHRLYIEFDYHIAKRINAISHDFQREHPQLSSRDWCYLSDMPCYQEPCLPGQYKDSSGPGERIKLWYRSFLQPKIDATKKTVGCWWNKDTTTRKPLPLQQAHPNDATKQEEQLRHEQAIQKIKTRLKGKELPWWFTLGTQTKVPR